LYNPTSCRHSMSGCFLHSLKMASYCVRVVLSPLVSPPRT
jgi:hypothetical protein